MTKDHAEQHTLLHVFVSFISDQTLVVVMRRAAWSRCQTSLERFLKLRDGMKKKKKKHKKKKKKNQEKKKKKLLIFINYYFSSVLCVSFYSYCLEEGVAMRFFSFFFFPFLIIFSALVSFLIRRLQEDPLLHMRPTSLIKTLMFDIVIVVILTD